jgi:hypothetical protein
MSPKKPKTGTPTRIPSGAKRPKVDEKVARGPDAGEHKVTFSFHYADHGHSGAWSWVSGAEAEELVAFLCDIGSLTWNEIKSHMYNNKRESHRKHHSQPVSSLCSEAQDRIGQLRLDEVFGEEIFRFRIGAKKRLWGFIAAGVFYILWWDGPHKVYPTEPG